MGDRINPGIGEQGPLARRMASTERFLGRFSKQRVKVFTPEGKPIIVDILASTATPGDAGTTGAGAFFAVFKKDGAWMLQGGQVSGGTKTEAVKDIELAKTGSEPSDGALHWLEIVGNGTVVSGRLVAGFTLTSVKDSKGSALPQNTLPTKDSPSGRKCVILLGSWNNSRFLPSQTGNIAVSFCPGTGYTVSRGT